MRTQAGLVLVAIGLILVAASLSTLFRNTRYWRWGNAPDADLDEYQVETRDRAYRWSYSLIVTLGLLGLLGFRIANDATGFSLNETQYELLFWGWLLIGATLPSALLAWNEQPLDED